MSTHPTPGQVGLFDLEQGQAAAEQGMWLADSAARVQQWKEMADAWLAELQVWSHFTADDLVAAVGLPDEGANRNNVVGAWMNAQSKKGLIEFAGRLSKSARVGRHTGLQRVWVKL